MGGFVLVRRDASGLNDENALRAVKCFERQGFGSPTKLETPDWTLNLFAKYGDRSPPSLVRKGDDFAAYTGTLIAAGETGTRALTKILDAFDGAGVDYDQMLGSFCLMIYRRGELHLFPDKLGIYKIYKNDAETVISSSFLAVLETIPRPTVNRQSVYEYVFQGATYDDRTVIDQVTLMERRTRFRLNRQIHRHDVRDDLWDGVKWSNVNDHIAVTLDILRRNAKSIVAAFGNNIDTALSGGYDSRFLLAMLLEQGIQPKVHVYGREQDDDVKLAKAMAAGEHFPLNHIDKQRRRETTPETYAAVVARNFEFFDGYPADGIFDNGADLDTRLERGAGAALALNGGGGEIFRNFFYLRDRSFTLHQFLLAYFSRYDNAFCTELFDERDYRLKLGRAMARLLTLSPTEPPETITLSRTQIEYLYPCFRCVYWMGRNNSVNNRFGYATTPFVETSLIKPALQIPIAFKNHGRFEAALIAAISPALAKYDSAYGHNFLAEPPVKRKFSDYGTLLRPIRARKALFQLRNRFEKHEPGTLLSASYLSKVIDVSFPELRRYFHMDRGADSAVLNRACTLEYLFERYRPGHGG